MVKYMIEITTNNLDFYDEPDIYILSINKHIPHGQNVLDNKISLLQKFANKNHGEIKITSPIYLSGDRRCVRVYIMADVIPMKEIDKLITERGKLI